MGRKSREKGKRGERELSGELSRVFGVECRRGQQFSGIEGQDVVGLPGIHIECKRVEKFSLYPSLAQAEADAAEGSVPVVFHRANGRRWVAVCYLDDLPKLSFRLDMITQQSKGGVYRLAEPEDGFRQLDFLGE